MTITSFSGEYEFLSNFYVHPAIPEVLYGYPTVEHFFQAMKTLDKAERETIKSQPTPGQSKRAGRRILLRDDWEDIKDEVMLHGVTHKFEIPELQEKLLDTYVDTLVEGNLWHDNYWGNCTCNNCPKTGKNRLGVALMRVRSEIE